MIIKRLRMENIRSYKAAEVEFPRGRTLFVGDIGSGKSTILMAVEFALFGLGSAKASSLLRMGESRGAVELDFEANGRDYWVRRALAKKGGSIQQVEGKLRGPEGEEDYPASEMKERMLEILNFREPTDPRSRSLIYQYAVYTPQEEMKQILALPASIRLQILRRAFGVEEYKLAMENAKELYAKIHGKKGEFEVAARDIPALRKEVSVLKEKGDNGDKELLKLERFEMEEEAAIKRLESEREELHGVETQLASARSDQGHLNREIKGLREEVEEMTQDIRDLGRKASHLKERAIELGRALEGRSVEDLKVATSTVRKEIERHNASAVEIKTKMAQYESVAEEGRCPVCDRDAKPEEFAEKIGRLSKESEVAFVHLQRLERELGELEEALDRRRRQDALAEKAREDLARAKEHEEETEKKDRRLASFRTKLRESEEKASRLETRIRVLEGEAQGLEPLRRKIEASQKSLNASRERIASLKTEIKKWREELQKKAESIAGKERNSSKARELGEREIWLEEYFVPTIESIERHVMTSINREFGSNFQRWFSILVEEGGKEARVDEEFTPLVEAEGYDQDIEFLSGGERTSVALAYRLALSQMVQKFAEVGRSSLILDEPTDGFSKEQLGKMREILDEMANPQVIMVSHERELESMVDQIYRVAKVDGESKISR